MKKFASKENIDPNLHKKKTKAKGPQKYIKTRNQLKKLNQKQQKQQQQFLETLPITAVQHEPQVTQFSKNFISEELKYKKQILHYILTNCQRIHKNQILKQKSVKKNTYETDRSCFLRDFYKKTLTYQLRKQTFYLFVNLLDRVITHPKNSKISGQEMLQFAYACFFMAMKYEQIYPPSIYHWLHSSLHSKIYEREAVVLQLLNFQLLRDSPFRFLEHYAQLFQLDNKQRQEGSLILDAFIFDCKSVQLIDASQLSLAVICLKVGYKTLQNKIKFGVNTTFKTEAELIKVRNVIEKSMTHNYNLQMINMWNKNNKPPSRSLPS